MELFKEFFMDWSLFSLIEGFIICYIFHKFGKLQKFKFYEVIFMSLGNCVISQLFVPLLYQTVQILFMIIVNKLYNKNVSSIYIIKVVCLSIIFFLITEIVITLLYDLFLNFNFTTCNKYVLFISMIPTRLLQILLILKGDILMKFWVGGVKR